VPWLLSIKTWQVKPYFSISMFEVFGFRHREHFRYSVCNNDEVISSITLIQFSHCSITNTSNIEIEKYGLTCQVFMLKSHGTMKYKN
jgi:hypothetical protein